MAIRCSHCKHTTVHTHTHSHTGFIQSIAEQHVTHTLGLSSIHIQSLQSRGDTGPVSVQISTGGKSNKKQLGFFLFSNKMNDFLLHNIFDHLCFFAICVVFHLCSLDPTLTPPLDPYTPNTVQNNTDNMTDDQNETQGRKEEKRLNVSSTWWAKLKSKDDFFFQLWLMGGGLPMWL